jgi:hypothetical protein
MTSASSKICICSFVLPMAVWLIPY